MRLAEVAGRNGWCLPQNRPRVGGAAAPQLRNPSPLRRLIYRQVDAGRGHLSGRCGHLPSIGHKVGDCPEHDGSRGEVSTGSMIERHKLSVAGNKFMKDVLLAAARSLDGGRWNEAREQLRSAPLVRSEPSQRLVAAALWKRILSSSCDGDRSVGRSDNETIAAFDDVTAPALGVADLWKTYNALPVLEAKLGAVDAAAILAAAAWDYVLKSNSILFCLVFELFFKAGGERCFDAWEQFITEQRDYVPTYWDFVLLTKSLSNGNHSDFATMAVRALRSAKRNDLAPLFDVYLKQTQQVPVSEILAAASALAVPEHRMRVADYMTNMGYMPEELETVVAAFGKLVAGSDVEKTSTSLMQARLANAEGRWSDVLGLAKIARSDPRYSQAADLLAALALSRLNMTQSATAILDRVVADKTTAPFHRSRSAFIRVTTALVSRGLPALEELQPKTFPVTSGRPLAQSLWVGRKLRWIERLAIKSYLNNGWRFQLYVYEDVENVPDNCEILDASAIIPAKDIFREGMRSGPHAGSIGAFSDLFRYQLLYKRGGMWTDTDVINFQKFDPDGQRFICTETSDAGVIGLNGAIMAAPAGDEFVGRAYERARMLLASNDNMFFTRIGPYLLAEILVEMGVDAIELMPPGFLSSISWMNAGSLLQPFAKVMARQDIRRAINLHVYTEIWRTLGLGLDRPPDPETFLGRLYADHFDDEEFSMQTEVSA